MSRKRQFGTIRKLRSGMYQARFRASDNRLDTAPATFRTKAEAGQWLASGEADRARHTWVDPRAGAISVREYADGWLAGKVRLAPRTREIYEHQLRAHILRASRANSPRSATSR